VFADFFLIQKFVSGNKIFPTPIFAPYIFFSLTKKIINLYDASLKLNFSLNFTHFILSLLFLQNKKNSYYFVWRSIKFVRSHTKNELFVKSTIYEILGGCFFWCLQIFSSYKNLLAEIKFSPPPFSHHINFFP
jgi:hypothetical protein